MSRGDRRKRSQIRLRTRGSACFVGLCCALLVLGACTSNGEGSGAPDDVSLATEPPGFPQDGVDSTTPSPGSVAASLSEAYEFTDLELGGGGWVTGMVIHPTEADLMYARTDVGGAYRWDPTTEHWIQLLSFETVPNPDPGDWQVSSVATSPSDPDRAYMAVGDSTKDSEGRILISDDRGATWQDHGRGFTIAGNAEDRIGGERLAVDPTDPDTVWFGSRSEGLLVSTDGSATWSPVPSVPIVAAAEGEKPTGVKWVLASEFGVFVGIAHDGVYQVSGEPSAPGEITAEKLWASEGIPLDAEIGSDGVLWVAEQKPPFVYRFDSSSREQRDVTPNGGKKFASVAIDPNNPSRVFIGRQNISDSGLWRTTDSGEKWKKAAATTTCEQVPWLDEYDDRLLSAGSMAFDPAGELWFPEGFAMWRSTDLDDGEVTFQCATLGIEELVSNDVLVTPAGSIVSAHWDRGAFRHTDGTPQGAIQGPVTEFNSVWDLDWSPADPDFVVAIVADHRFCCEDSSDAYVSSFSTDGGQSWERFGSYKSGNHPYKLRFGNIAVSATDTNNLVWLPTFNLPPQFSRDRGTTWSEVILPGTEDIQKDGVNRGGSHTTFFLNRKVLAADRVAADTFYLYQGDFGVYRSTDGGQSWALMASDGLPIGSPIGHFHSQLQAVPGEEGHLFFTTGPLDQGVWPAYESVDGGDSWTEVDGTGEVTAIGFGSASEVGGPVTVFLAGELNGERGLWRSIDGAVTWGLISAAPGGNYLPIQAITGHPDEFGTVFVAFGGTTVKVGASTQGE